MSTQKAPKPELVVADAAAWEDWLASHEDSSDGVLLVLAKKGVREPTSLTYGQALDAALCSGWIDGQRRSRDGETFLQMFTPRRARSLWSQRNVGLVEALMDGGRMRERGMREVRAAQQDGRWAAAYAGSATATVPPDLTAALEANPAARERFEALNSQERFVILVSLTTARTPELREKRLARAVAKLAGE